MQKRKLGNLDVSAIGYIGGQTVSLASLRGHTVVLGLGMGWQAANAALPDAVK